VQTEHSREAEQKPAEPSAFGALETSGELEVVKAADVEKGSANTKESQ
jgi:hypothetical protein